jgi:hypothetical protein
MAIYTKAKIFNMALKNLGVSVGVQSEGQNDRNSVVLNEFYDTAKEKTLTDFDWSFASAYRELTPTGGKSPNPKYSQEYDYPNDCLFVREIVTADETQQIDFETASNTLGKRVIYTNESPATIRYTRLLSEEVYYTPEFAMALSWYLAFLSAKSITGARTNTSDCLQIYKQMLMEGMTTDANEGFKKNEDVCEWIEARD